MKLPKSDGQISFATGGVLLNKASTNVWLQFYSKLNRVITEIPVPYYIFQKANKQQSEAMIETAWRAACEFASEKAISRPDSKTVASITTSVQELLKTTKD